MPRAKKIPSPPARENAPRVAVAIMAAGKGTRLKSKHPKVLHSISGKPLLAHVIAAASKLVPPQDIHVIIGHEANRVREAVAHSGVNFVLQAQQRGTGHALMVARDALLPYDHVLVLYGDAPLITSESIEKLRDFHLAKKASMTVLTATLEDPTGYGRVIRKGPNGDEVKAIVEEKSADASQKKIREINSGFYAFAVPALISNLDKLTTQNVHGEYYLTDMADILAKKKQRVVAIKTNDAAEVLGSNTRAELADNDIRLRMAKCQRLMAEGVTIFFPQTCVIDSDVEVGADTIIEPFVQLLGKTRIGSDCRIRSYSVITNSEVGDRTVIQPGTVMDGSRVGVGATLGPYSRLRPGSDIGDGAHLGNFVETKKVKMGKGSKANHLTYLGDTEVGEGVNVGAGTITCNYDGVHKHKTIIEDGVFVGSDSTLVAPVRLGKGSYIGAASCITDDVPPDALAIGRGRQIVKEGWAKANREARAAAKSK
jgi:bifunctional UDP-N-acetylglucosamine pyrophosphorylase / glucosamine-1-phosphate N-acetyltransferase